MLANEKKPTKKFVEITVKYCVGESEEQYSFSQDKKIFYDSASDFLSLMDDFLPAIKKECFEHLVYYERSIAC